jgi:hypothetical protein
MDTFLKTERLRALAMFKLVTLKHTLTVSALRGLVGAIFFAIDEAWNER